MIDWFNDLSLDKNIEENHLEFLEPNLNFCFIERQNDKKKIRINFELESRPKSANDNISYFVDGIWSNNELKQIASELKTELNKFPERKSNTVVENKSSIEKKIEVFKWWQFWK